MKSARFAALAAVSLLLLSASSALAAPPDLGGQSWRASADEDPAWATSEPNDVVTTTSRTCDPLGGATLTMVAEGDAQGPYPGRFRETVSVELGPVMRDVFDDRDVTSVSGTFSVDSAVGQVEGTFGTAADPSAPTLATGWCLNDPLPNADYVTPQTVAGGAVSTYDATITTPDGCRYVDHGGDVDPTDDLIFAGGFDVREAPYPTGRTVAQQFQSDGAPLEAAGGCTQPSSFEGFFAPVDNLPVFNEVNAGRAVPVKFSLGGDRGLDIFADGYPRSEGIDCGGRVDPVAETTTAGSSSLSYDAGSDRYVYVWKTESDWAGSCRQLVLKLADGSVHRANFSFK
jgi:hypothetical protein